MKKNIEAKLKPYLGFSVNPYYYGTRIKPKISFNYPVSKDRMGASFALVPRIVYNFNEKWSLDLNIPICLADISYSAHRIDDPALPLSDRTNNSIELTGFPEKYMVRLGVGLTF